MHWNSQTGYTVIPTTSITKTSNSSLEFFSEIKEKGRTFLTTSRPWREVGDTSALSKPYTYNEVVSRIRKNTSYFRVNYTLMILIIMFLSLLWHPVSMIVFLLVFVGWFFLFFFREEPLVVMNWVVDDDRIIVIGLSLVTVVALSFTHVGSNVLVSLIVGAVVVGLHAAFRGTDDLYLDEEEALNQGILSSSVQGVRTRA